MERVISIVAKRQEAANQSQQSTDQVDECGENNRAAKTAKKVVDVLIPALNEEEALPFVLKPLHQLRERDELSLSKMSIRRILVLDNGSTDATAEVALAHNAEVISAPKRGYGSACLEGLKALQDSPPDVVLFLDADGSDDLRDLDPLLSLLSRSALETLGERERIVTTAAYRDEMRRSKKVHSEVTMVIGSRPRRAEKGALTPLQRFGNALSCTLLRFVFGAEFTDLGPFRAIRWRSIEALNMADENFGWTVEMQAKACALNLLCAEYDVAYHPRRAGESKVSGSISGSIRAGIKILWVIGRAWWRK